MGHREKEATTFFRHRCFNNSGTPNDVVLVVLSGKVSSLKGGSFKTGFWLNAVVLMQKMV